MEMNARLALTLGGICMFAAVALGAFGAHALKGHLDPDMTAVWQSAVQYHAWHALALLGAGGLMLHWPAKRGLALAAWMFLAGIVLFAGSLYAGAARLASTVARAGVWPCGTHASHTAFIAAKSLMSAR